METQKTTKIDLLSKMNEENVNFFQFHIIPKVLKHFYRTTSNKSFLLYLLFLELSNRKGFCYLNTKEVVQTFFEMTAKSICNWIKEMHNVGFITTLYDAKQHFWVVRVNTKWHIKLWEKYSDGSLEELLKANEKEISEEKLNKIIADVQEFALTISKNSDNENANESIESSESNANDDLNADSTTSSESSESNADSVDNANENNNDSSDLKDSQSAIVENVENPNTNKNGGNDMSATAMT